MTTTNTYGRQVVVPLTNKSGGSVAAGDVVVIDTTNNDAFTTSTAGAFTGLIGVAQETIANNATGRVLTAGYAALVNVNASVTRGNFGKTHTVAKQATDAGSSRVAGTFCQFLTGGTTPDAHVFGIADFTSGAGTGTLTTVKDEGSNLSTAVVSLDFVGAGVTATGTTAVTVTIPGGAYQQNQMTSDVTIAATGTDYDGPAVTLSAGTWFLAGQAFILDPTGIGGIVGVKLWDGTTVLANAQYSPPSVAQWNQPVHLSGVVVIASGTPTWKISVRNSSGTSRVIKAAGDGTNAAGNVASTLTAVRIA